jgi:putative oxidoreductase
MHRLAPVADFCARALLAALFIRSGVLKLLAPAATKAYIAASSGLNPSLSYLVAIAIEIGAGAALIANYRTRPAALILCAFTLVTAFVFHGKFADPTQATQLMKNLSIAGGLLYVALHTAPTRRRAG